MCLMVDTKKLENEVKNLDKYISNYSDNSANIYFELSKLNSYWKDSNSDIFEEKINHEKVNNLDIVEMLEKVSSFYKEVENTYYNVRK